MSLLQDWRDYAYGEELNRSKEGQKFWEKYFQLEKGIYEQLLATPDEVVSGTVKELAEKYEVPLSMMVGFLDGINDSLKEPNPIEEMEEDTPVKLDIDLELLYKNMVDNNADWLYNLPQWEPIFDEARNCTRSRKPPERSGEKAPRWDATIPAPAVPEKNISSAAGETDVQAYRNGRTG